MKYLNKVKKSVPKLAVAFVALSSWGVASAGAVTDAITAHGATIQADIAEAGGFIIGLAMLAMGYRWVKATFF